MSRKISGRLIAAVITTMIEETAIAVIVLWGLPAVGADLPLWGTIVLLVVVMAGWGTWSIWVYLKGSQALRREPLIGLPNMLGTEGKVVSALAPQGLVKIRSELWVAESESGEIEPGGDVTVVGQDRLKLIVRQSGTLSERG